MLGIEPTSCKIESVLDSGRKSWPGSPSVTPSDMQLLGNCFLLGNWYECAAIGSIQYGLNINLGQKLKTEILLFYLKNVWFHNDNEK